MGIKKLNVSCRRPAHIDRCTAFIISDWASQKNLRYGNILWQAETSHVMLKGRYVEPSGDLPLDLEPSEE